MMLLESGAAVYKTSASSNPARETKGVQSSLDREDGGVGRVPGGRNSPFARQGLPGWWLQTAHNLGKKIEHTIKHWVVDSTKISTMLPNAGVSFVDGSMLRKPTARLANFSTLCTDKKSTGGGCHWWGGGKEDE